MSAKSSKKEENEQNEFAARSPPPSPSPSALSTASSGSPLIRANSTSSSASSSSQRSSGAAGSPHQQQARRPAPTSIAAAQLQQHFVKQQQNGNKLANMSLGQLQQAGQKKQQVNYRLQEEEQQQHKCKEGSKLGGAHASKGLGYNLGKMIAYRANRFNEFWSVNKMRYMNLACLLMTLVCLLTILLFSKSNVGETQPERQLPLKRSRLAAAAAASPIRLDGHTLHADQEPPFESIDALDRQPFVMGTSRRRSSADLDADAAALDESKHEPTDKLSGPFDELLQDARRQLRRQQQIEREAEESGGSTSNSSETKIEDANKLSSSLAEPNVAQLFDDLDNFGLFKVIKSQLLKANLSQAQPTIVRTSPHGATIIMSLSGGNSSAFNSNGTANPMGSLLEKLLPPIFRPPASMLLDDDSAAKSAPRGLATITIRSEPLFRGPLMPTLPFSASPFATFSMRPSESLVNPFISTSHPMAPPGGLFGALLRATSELMADQMAQLEAGNKTELATSNSSNKEALSQQASHRATIVRLPLATGANSTGSGNSSSGGESLDEEVETFDVGREMASRMGPPPPPFAFMRSPISPLIRSLFAAGSRGRPASIIINSRSSAPDSLFEGPSMGADFGSDSAPPPLNVLPSTPFAPSLMMPHMIMFGSSAAQSGAPPMLRALMAASKQMEQREKEASSNSVRRDDREQETADSEGWHEQFASGSASKLMPRHRSVPDSNEDETLDQPPFFSTVSSGASSLIENMLESTNGAAPVGRVSGTIKQVFRGPGMTVERIIELPSNAQQLRHFRHRGQVQAVAPGVRSQSISRLEDDSPTDQQKAAASQRVASFAGPAQERNDAPELEREFVGPLSMSRAPVGGFISRLFSDLSRHQESGETYEDSLPSLHPLGSFLSGASSIFGPLSAVAKSQRQQRAFSVRSMAEDEPESDSQDPDEQLESEPSQPVWSPKMRLNSARIRVNPVRHDQLLPSRFAMPAEAPTRQEMGRLEARVDERDNSRMQRAMKAPLIRSIDEQQQQQKEAKPSTAFTSPNSSLFGFPAMKAPVAATSDKLQPRATETSARPFVYHSNHELAGFMGRSNESRGQQKEQREPLPAGAESRSSYQHRPSTGAQSVAGVPAAIGMGRRLDEGELIN